MSLLCGDNHNVLSIAIPLTTILLSSRSIRIVKGKCKGDWYHESFIRGKPGLLSKMKRTRIKGVRKLQTRDKPKARKCHPVRTSTSESVGGYDQKEQEDTERECENCSYVSDSTRLIYNTSSSRSPVFHVSFEDEDIMADFSCQSSGFSESDAIICTFEPLPIHSAGILDGTMKNNELVEFGQLLDRLI